MKLLIVEDELDLLSEIENYFLQEGYLCETATEFNSASEKLEIYSYDLVIVDITLPGGSGLELIRQLKKLNTSTGILVLSAKNSLDDKLTGLDLGADDYLTKPFHFAELNARVKSILRRRKFEGSEKLIFNEIEIDHSSSSVKVNDIPVILTKKEFELFLFFITNKNRLLTKESIAEHLWGDNIDLADNFDFIYTHINNLRKKIAAANGTDYLKTVYGMGYKYTDL
ncbi:MAG: response regulator transcription factor [Prolixibacteraceae bacterium]